MSNRTTIREAGWQALVEKLGVPGALEFLNEYSAGSGDYTKTHQAWAKSVSDEKLFAKLKSANSANRSGAKRRRRRGVN